MVTVAPRNPQCFHLGSWSAAAGFAAPGLEGRNIRWCFTRNNALKAARKQHFSAHLFQQIYLLHGAMSAMSMDSRSGTFCIGGFFLRRCKWKASVNTCFTSHKEPNSWQCFDDRSVQSDFPKQSGKPDLQRPFQPELERSEFPQQSAKLDLWISFQSGLERSELPKESPELELDIYQQLMTFCRTALFWRNKLAVPREDHPYMFNHVFQFPFLLDGDSRASKVRRKKHTWKTNKFFPLFVPFSKSVPFLF